MMHFPLLIIPSVIVDERKDGGLADKWEGGKEVMLSGWLDSKVDECKRRIIKESFIKYFYL